MLRNFYYAISPICKCPDARIRLKVEWMYLTLKAKEDNREEAAPDGGL